MLSSGFILSIWLHPDKITSSIYLVERTEFGWLLSFCLTKLRQTGKTVSGFMIVLDMKRGKSNYVSMNLKTTSRTMYSMYYLSNLQSHFCNNDLFDVTTSAQTSFMILSQCFINVHTDQQRLESKKCLYESNQSHFTNAGQHRWTINSQQQASGVHLDIWS